MKCEPRKSKKILKILIFTPLRYMLKSNEVNKLRQGLLAKLKVVEIEYQSITHKNLVDTVGLKR